MDRRDFLSSAAMLADVSAAAGKASPPLAKKGGGAQTSLKRPHLSLSTQRGGREAWAKLAVNTDMKSSKYGWYTGTVQGVRPGEVIRDLVGFTGFCCAKLQPNKWPRENAHPFTQVTETFLYKIDWRDMQNAKKTSVEYNITWTRTTPRLPWMLMGPTPGHCSYQCFMGAYDDINQIDRKILDHVEKNHPKYMKAPDAWSDVVLSSLENYSREQKPAPVRPKGPKHAPDPELPAWIKAAMQARGGGALK